jgi:inner membrane protein
VWILGDLRFDREPELGMSEIEVGIFQNSACGATPPWIPPRQALLTATR